MKLTTRQKEILKALDEGQTMYVYLGTFKLNGYIILNIVPLQLMQLNLIKFSHKEYLGNSGLYRRHYVITGTGKRILNPKQ